MMQSGSQSEPPAGTVPITTDELLATVGELYVQVRMLRQILARKQQQQQQQPVEVHANSQ